MALTRRRLLGLCGVATSSLIGGCTGLNPLERGGDGLLPGAGTATGTGAGAGSGSGTPTGARNGTVTPTPTPTPAGGDESATDRAYAELQWFATRYRPTVDRYRSTAQRARSLLGTLERQSSVSEADVERLRGLLARFEEVLYEGLVPHFDVEPTVRSFNDERLGRIATFRQRSDWDGVQRVLAEMEERYRTLASDAYVARHFPVDPIRGPLARLLTADGAASEAAVRCYLPPADYLARVQADPDAYEGEIDGGRSDVREYERQLAPVSIVASRASRAYLTYTSLVHGLQSQPVFVQRYRDAAAAEGAVGRMLSDSGSVTADGTAALGGAEWRRVYYQAAGGVTYAHLRRTGRYVLTVAPSRTPWGDRAPDWTTPLELTWFWE
ncbi:MAG: hypothetical protein ABEJ61_03065 [Haloferacaceae archaeon]